MQDLKDKKAIVTGAAQGLGWAMAEGLCQSGVKVCILDVSPELGQVVKDLKEKDYQVEGLNVDLSKSHEIQEGFNNAVHLLDGKLDILINNAGVHKPMPAVDLPVDDFKKILDVNVAAAFELAKLSYQEMKEKGNGKIINIASVLATQGGYNASAYSASKGAIAQLTKSLSNEWTKDGIHVNAVAPGYYETELNRHILNDEERLESLVSRVPMGRLGQPNELVGLIQFLSSNISDFINGAVIPVDGGFLGR